LLRLNSYVQRQPLYTIAGGMPTATVELGDRRDAQAGWIGPYIGETLGRALLHEQVTNCLSSVFAFRSTERGEVANVMSLLGVAPSDEHKAVLRALGNGECIFRDLDDRAGRIGIDLVSDELRDWIDTNPTRARSGQPGPGSDAVGAPAAGASS